MRRQTERMKWNKFAGVIDIMGYGITAALKIQQSPIRWLGVSTSNLERKRLRFFSRSKVCFIYGILHLDLKTSPSTLNAHAIVAKFPAPRCDMRVRCAPIWNRNLLWVPAAVFLFHPFRRTIQPKNKEKWIKNNENTVERPQLAHRTHTHTLHVHFVGLLLLSKLSLSEYLLSVVCHSILFLRSVGCVLCLRHSSSQAIIVRSTNIYQQRRHR